MTTIREKEVSYTFAYSQDVLYRIKDWADSKLVYREEYVEILDTNDVRTRLQDLDISSIKKCVVELKKIVVPLDDTLVPVILRECTESEVYTGVCDKIKRLCKTRVYRTDGDIELKFEHIYYEHHTGDELDPLTVSKQLALYNLLKPGTTIDSTTNSHLGSDEILANCRLEMEYVTLEQQMLLKTARLINFIETVVVGDVIVAPFISHTNMLNEIYYRPFVAEKLLCNISSHDERDIELWALKLNGVRGKAYIVNGERIYIQLDDMQMFSGKLTHSDVDGKKKFCHNRIVCTQVEYMSKKKLFYITDVVSVYKYKYDNRNQYNLSTSVAVDVFNAVAFINKHNRKLFKFGEYTLKFQEFHTNRKQIDKNKEENDGYVGIGGEGGLVKIKWQKTFEMKCVGPRKLSCSLGEFTPENGDLCKEGLIYEVILLEDDLVRVLTERTDRLISN